jgi:chitinase
MRTLKLATIAAALCLIGPGASAQNLLTNGNFETGNLTGWTYSGGVNVQALMGVSSSDAAVFTALSAPAEGDISQTVTTYTTGTYTLSFDLKGYSAPVSGFGSPDAPLKTSEFIALVGAT